MARNLVLFDPADNNWCVDCYIGTIGDTPRHVLVFAKSEEDANEVARILRKKFETPANIRVFEYKHAKDEMDLLKLALLDVADVVVKYLAG